MIESIDLRHNNKRAWATTKKPNTVNQPQSHIAAVAPSDVKKKLFFMIGCFFLRKMPRNSFKS